MSDGTLLAAGGFAVLVLLLGLRAPVGAAMLAVGAGGYALAAGVEPLLAVLKTQPWYALSSASLAVVPLFLLMGQFATRAGLGRDLFRAAGALVGHRPGGMAIAAIGACAGFGSICGSSLATAATMGQVALPEMRRHGYSGALATGTLAAGGTLGVLIPPSLVLVVYAVMAEANIAKLFAAALLPGLLAAAGYMAAIAVVARLDPAAGPAGPRADSDERRRSLIAVWPVAAVFLTVVGGIYGGWFTPTEGAAVGAAAAGALAVVKGRMGLAGLAEALMGTAQSTAMVFLILLGADLFNAFLGHTGLPRELARLAAEAGWAPLAVLALMLLAYLLLGCVMDSLSMILLTVPVFLPVILALDFGMTPEATALWFGILILVVVEVGLITPPVGLNVLVINAQARAQGHAVPVAESFRGVLPFLASDAVRVALLVAFPWLALGPVALVF